MSVMNDVFKDYTDSFVKVYLDDILVYSHSWDDHVQHVQLALDRLKKHKLYVNLSKCTFGIQELDFLGFVCK